MPAFAPLGRSSVLQVVELKVMVARGAAVAAMDTVTPSLASDGEVAAAGRVIAVD